MDDSVFWPIGSALALCAIALGILLVYTFHRRLNQVQAVANTIDELIESAARTTHSVV